MLRIACALGLLLALALPAPAHAGWRLDRARAIADIVWQHPCAGNTTYTLASLGNDYDGAVTDTDHCHIIRNTDLPLSWMNFCSTMIHEYGHLAGFRDPLNVGPGWKDTSHSHNPNSIMAASYWPDRRCEHRGRPYLERHGLLTSPSRSAAQPHGRCRRSTRSAARPQGRGTGPRPGSRCPTAAGSARLT